MSESDKVRAPPRDLLLANHAFPGEYVIKAFGPGTEGFHRDVAQSAHNVVGAGNVQTSVRETRSGHKSCVTVTIQVQTVDDVIATYEALHTVVGLFFML